MRVLPLLAVLFLLAGCGGSAPAVDRAASSPDGPDYGLSEANPIHVGLAGAGGEGGPSRERAYLDRLRGPDGSPVRYEREGSCCAFETPEGRIGGMGLLDMYEVTGGGLDAPVTLYLNMYDPPREGEAGRAPEGFTLAPAG